jgi:toxin ParE1/3/4
MEIKVVWTDSAIDKLSEIFNYYNSVAGTEIADDIINKIVDRTIYLEKHPFIGAKEELLYKRKREYRYLVEGNYKIIYWVDDAVITIATVFDTRQNPRKILK